MKMKLMEKQEFDSPKNSASRGGMFALFALALLLFSAISSASVNPKLELLNYTVSEDPAQPGHVVALALHIKSLEFDNCASRVAVQLMVSYPLSIQGSDTQYLETLCYNDSDATGTFTFYLPIDNLATLGTYPVAVSTTYEKGFTQLSESNTVNLRVGGAPSFAASVTSSNPVDIYAGDSSTVTVTLQNTGSSMVQDAIASATSSGIEVKWAGADQAIGTIQARGSANAVFSIEAPKNLPPGTYPLNVKLDYTGEDKQNGSVTFHFDVPVKPKAEFLAVYDLNGTLRAGAAQTVNVTLTNSGTQTARKVKVRINPLFPFSTDGTVRYIDTLAPGQSANLTYVITVDKDATAGSQLSGLLMNFEDPQGKAFSDSADFSIPVREATFSEMLEQYNLFIYIIVIVVALVVVRRVVGMFSKKKTA